MRFPVRDEHAGKRVRCPQCQAMITAGGPPGSPAPRPRISAGARRLVRRRLQARQEAQTYDFEEEARGPEPSR